MKKRKSIKELFRYHFDIWLSKGTVSMIILLLVITGIIVLLLSLLTLIFGGINDISLSGALWGTLNHTFDSGVLSGDDGPRSFLFIMLLATMCGVFFTALLIGLINDGISSRMQDLAKGIEPVIEKNHVVILGFNESTFIIIGELIEAYDNQGGKRNAVVIMDTIDKQMMEERIRTQYPNTGNITIVCRSGSTYNYADLERCSITTCKSIIIALENDFDTIKSILACTQILNSCETAQAFITSVINRKENEFAARLAGNDKIHSISEFSVENDRLELILVEGAIAKIMTHTCRQNGLSNVFTEIFNFSGEEFYIVKNDHENKDLFTKIKGKTIREINRCLPEAIVAGYIGKNREIIIDDPNQVIPPDNCKLIVLETDDNKIKIENEQRPNYKSPTELYENRPVSILIMDCNSKLPLILRELCLYLSPGSMIYLAAGKTELKQALSDNIIFKLLRHDIDSSLIIKKEFSDSDTGAGESSIYDYQNLEKLLDECNPNYVLTLSNQTEDDNLADEKSLMLLLYCRHYKMLHPKADFGVTCEMRRVTNQSVAQDTIASDFIISRNIAALMMSQIAENRELKDVFELLLSSDGFEIYMKPAKYYLEITDGMESDIFSIVDAVAEKHEIFIGYCLKSEQNGGPILNPPKMRNGKLRYVKLCSDDQFVVLAEDPMIKN